MATGLKPRGFVWVVKDRLAVSERIGGHGFQHRRVRREEEITWLVDEAHITAVVTLLEGNQNHAAYRQAGFSVYRQPVGPLFDAEDVARVFGTLDEALGAPGAVVLVHRDIVDDTVAGLLAGYLVHSGLLDDQITAAAVIQEIVGRPLGPEGRGLIPAPRRD